MAGIHGSRVPDLYGSRLPYSEYSAAGEDDEGADDEANGNKKLKDHQAAGGPTAPEACGHLSFQNFDRLKGGKGRRRGSCLRDNRPAAPGG